MYKVLIIEDDRTISHIYKKKLEKEGYIVEAALDGQSGIQRFHSFEPDVVLLDIFLPKVSGIEILNHIRSSHTTQNCFVVAFSGSRENLKEAEKLGASKIFSKDDISPTQIVARITEMLASKSEKNSESEEDSEVDIPDHLVEELESLGGKSKLKPYELKDRILNVENKDVKDGAVEKLESEPRSSKGRVLIVEDDLVTLHLVKEIVKSEGYTPETANDGMEGYKVLINDKSFVMAIFDIKMPKMSGTDLLRIMRKDKRLENIPVLLMSSESVSGFTFESLSTGVIVFVPKPFTKATFRTMFSMCLDRKNQI